MDSPLVEKHELCNSKLHDWNVQMARQAKQRFVSLDVGEVSLVDSPANEREFAVVKSLNQEDIEMADKTEVTKSDDTVENVSLEVAKATSEAVEKAMAQVGEVVKATMEAANAASDVEQSESNVNKSDDTDSEDVEKGLTKEQKAMRDQMRKKLESQCAAKGMKGDMLTKAVDVAMRALAGQGAFMPGASAKKPEQMKDTSKSDEPGSEDSDVAKSAGVNTQEIVNEVIKQVAGGLQGAQAISAPSAQKALKAAIETLQELMKQVSMQSVPVGGMPKNNLPSSTMYGGSGIKDVTKALEPLNETLGSLRDAQKALTERIEQIEKTRQPDTSGGGSDDTVTQETKKSMWQGVL